MRILNRTLIATAVFLSFFSTAKSQNAIIADSLYFDGYDCHIQGIAADTEKGYMFISFTDVFLKTDMKGNIIGSIIRIPGHLGDMAFSPEERKVYASLEFKDDEIGQGIAKRLGIAPIPKGKSRFCIAVIDVDKVDSIGMSGEGNDILKTVFLQEVTDDYNAVTDNGNLHKYGCSGIDGVTIAPAIGRKSKKECIYIAYGIYSDTGRDDNDNQVILCYDLDSFNKYAIPASYDAPADVKEIRNRKKYFIHTGNTSYGVQNLAYDKETGLFLMGVYCGKKPEYPNFSLFAFSLLQKDRKKLELSSLGICDVSTGIHGWNAKLCTTGMFPIGNGLWYIAESGKTEKTGQFAKIRLYRWTGNEDGPFERVK